MGVLSESVGLVFKMKADGASETSTAIKRVEGDVKDLSKQSTSLDALAKSSTSVSAGFTSLINPATLAAAGIAAIGTAAITVTTQLFNMAKAASDLGSEIQDFQEKTGLASDTIQTLKFNAEQAGGSMSELQAPLRKVTELMAQAQQGNEEAIATLKKFGVTDFTNLDAGLTKIFEKIKAGGNEIEKFGASAEVFGTKGAAAMKVVANAVDGDLTKAIAKAKEFGVVLTEEDIKAADEFGDALALMSKQGEVAAAKFALEYAPQITAAMKDVGTWIAKNGDEIREWGRMVSNTAQGAQIAFSTFSAFMDYSFRNLTFGLVQSSNSFADWARVIVSSLGLVGASLVILERLGAYFRQPEGASAGASGDSSGLVAAAGAGAGLFGTSPSVVKMPRGGGGGGRRASSGGANDAQQAEEKRQKAIADDLKDQEEARLALLKNQTDEFIAQQELKKDELERTMEGIELANQLRFIEESIFAKKRDLINAQIATSNPLNQRELNELLHSREMLDIEQKRYNAKAANDIKELDRLKDLEDRINAEKAIADEVQRQLNIQHDLEEVENRRKETLEQMKPSNDGINASQPGNGSTPDDPYSWHNVIGEGVPETERNLTSLGGVIGDLKTTAVDAFMQMGRGFSEMIGNWVLTGKMGENATRKMVASVLAGLAAQSIQLAIFHTAMGIAALTPWGAILYGSPTLHFQAAAMWGAVGVGAALAGRAVAGDAFNKKANTNFTSSQIGSNNTSRSVSDTTNLMSESRINRQEQRITLEVMSRDSHIVKVVGDNLNNRGDLHPVVVKLVEAN